MAGEFDHLSQLALDEARQSGYDEGHADGLQEGLETGLQEGTLLALRAALLRMTNHRFGSTDNSFRLRVASENRAEQLYAWMDKIISASGIDEIQDLFTP